MVDVFHQALELREQSAEYRSRAGASADPELRERFHQLAARYDDVARTLHTLAIGTAFVLDLERQSHGLPMLTRMAAE
jgi:hypothetical protein